MGWACSGALSVGMGRLGAGLERKSEVGEAGRMGREGARPLGTLDRGDMAYKRSRATRVRG